MLPLSYDVSKQPPPRPGHLRKKSTNVGRATKKTTKAGAEPNKTKKPEFDPKKSANGGADLNKGFQVAEGWVTSASLGLFDSSLTKNELSNRVKNKTIPREPLKTARSVPSKTSTPRVLKTNGVPLLTPVNVNSLARIVKTPLMMNDPSIIERVNYTTITTGAVPVGGRDLLDQMKELEKQLRELKEKQNSQKENELVTEHFS